MTAPRTPEAKAATWRRMALLAGSIRDEETRAQYLADWRWRYDLAFPPPPPGLSEEAMLPDGSVGADLSKEGAGVRAALVNVARGWLDRQIEQLADPVPADVNVFAWGLARRVVAGLLTDGEARDALDDVAALAPDADRADIDKAWAAGERKGYDLAPELLTLRCSRLQRTDLGNAERFRERYGRDFLYTTAKGWLGYDGRRYRVLVQEKDVTPAEVMGAVFETVRGIQEEARLIAATGAADDDMLELPGQLDRMIDSGRKKERLSTIIAKWGRTSESAGKLGCIANLAKRWLTVEITDFDINPMLLNCHNGTLVFHRPDDDGPARVELREHRRDDLLTKLTACDYDAEADAPEWQKLVRWAQPKSERRRYLRQWLGYGLTGDMGEQIFHIWWGPTAANGKSTVGNAAREASGDYGDITNVETFLDEGMKKRGDQATPDIVRLPGVRLLTSGEPGPGSKFNEPLINSVTGGDPMLARDNFRSFFRFSPVFKWTVWCNKMPNIVQGTEGIWRRAKVLLWESHLTEHEKDRTLPDRLKREHAGILAWMVRGAIDWMEHGFIEPDDVREASAAYRDDSDPLATFLRFCAVEEVNAKAASAETHAVFCAWAKASGEKEWTQKGLTEALKTRGFDKKKSSGMFWHGFRLVKSVHDFLDEKGAVRSDIEATDADAEPYAAGDDPGWPPGADGARAPPDHWRDEPL